jgi:uncharacterized membrane protein
LRVIFLKPAQAGIFICNDTGTKLYVAIGFQENDDWSSRGWFSVSPRECINPVHGALPNRYYYYYAEGGNLVYGGGDNSGFFCIHPKDKFYYSQAPGCTGKNFRRIDVGESDQYTFSLTETSKDPLVAARNCAGYINDGKAAFAKCWMKQVATDKQKHILDCVSQTSSAAAMAVCATKGSLSSDGRRVAECAQEYAETKTPRLLARCLARGQIDEKTEDLIRCATNNSLSSIAICTAGVQMTEKQRRLVNCVAENNQDYKAAATCIVADRLSPEQRTIATA